MSSNVRATPSWERQVDQYQKYISAHPNTVAPPVDSKFNGITFAYSPTNSQHSYGDAVWIKQYNGAYQGNYIAWQNTGLLAGEPPYWIFHRLNNSGYDYVEAVCNKAP